MTLDDLWHPPRPGPSYWDYRCLVCGAPVDDHPSFWQRLKRWIRRLS